MKRCASAAGIVIALCVEVGCPQLEDDQFRRGSATSGAGGASDAGSAGATALSGSGGTPAEAGPAQCGLDELTGPNGVCYFADSAESTWGEARTSCKARGVGWDLAVIGDPEENSFVRSITAYEAWIGATDVGIEGRWMWVDEAEPFFEGDAGTASMRFSNWAEGEPNDYDDSDCLRMLTTGLWADWPCDSPMGRVCRRSP